MSIEEDIEVRDLIVQKTLIPNGCLAKVRVSKINQISYSNFNTKQEV